MTKSASSPSEPAPTVATAPHQAIYRRWRAQTFGQIVGQTAVVQTLQNAVRTGRVAHAILFVGPRGTGKTSLARILAKAVNCTDLRDGDPCDVCPSCAAIREGRALDLIEIDAASNRGIDAIRELRERINYAPTDLKRKVYILDEAHQITKDAWNALLKSLEEPPDFVVFMFASTHPQDFPPAILSRLQRFDVRRLTPDEIEGKLVMILEGDGRVADPAALRLIARLAAGGMRDAESMLDQLLASGGDRLDEDTVRDLLGLAAADTVEGFVTAMVEGDISAGVRILDELEDRGRDLRAFLEQLVEVIRTGMVGSRDPSPVMPAEQSVTDMVRLARRLGAIDPNRAGIGGLRLQLELALFPADDGPVRTRPAVAADPLAPNLLAVGVSGAPRVRARVGDSSRDVPSAAPPAPSAGTPGLATTAGQKGAPSPAAAPTSAEAPATDTGAPATDTGPTTTAAASAAAPAPSAAGAEAGAGGRGAGPAAIPTREPTPRTRPSTPPTAAGKPPGPADVSIVTPEAGSDLDRLRLRWPEVVATISAHPPTKPLIAVCLPISVEDGIVTLGFPEDQGFLRDVAERRRSVLEDGIAAVLGRSVGVRCVATNLDRVPPLPADAEAAFILAEARRIFETNEPDATEVS